MRTDSGLDISPDPLRFCSSHQKPTSHNPHRSLYPTHHLDELPCSTLGIEYHQFPASSLEQLRHPSPSNGKMHQGHSSNTLHGIHQSQHGSPHRRRFSEYHPTRMNASSHRRAFERPDRAGPVSGHGHAGTPPAPSPGGFLVVPAARHRPGRVIESTPSHLTLCRASPRPPPFRPPAGGLPRKRHRAAPSLRSPRRRHRFLPRAPRTARSGLRRSRSAAFRIQYTPRLHSLLAIRPRPSLVRRSARGRLRGSLPAPPGLALCGLGGGGQQGRVHERREVLESRRVPTNQTQAFA